MLSPVETAQSKRDWSITGIAMTTQNIRKVQCRLYAAMETSVGQYSEIVDHTELTGCRQHLHPQVHL